MTFCYRGNNKLIQIFIIQCSIHIISQGLQIHFKKFPSLLFHYHFSDYFLSSPYNFLKMYNLFVVIQSYPTLGEPLDCNMPGFPVFHHLSELAQTHVHWVGDATQPTQPMSSPSPPDSIFPSIRVFSNESGLCIRWTKYWSFLFMISLSSEYSG